MCSCFFSCIVSFNGITYVARSAWPTKQLKSFQQKRGKRGDTEEIWWDCATTARYILTYSLKIALSHESVLKILWLCRRNGTEGVGVGDGSRARRKDLRLVNQPTPPRFRFIIMKYPTPFLFNITFTLYHRENIKYSLTPQTTSDAFKLPFVWQGESKYFPSQRPRNAIPIRTLCARLGTVVNMLDQCYPAKVYPE